MKKIFILMAAGAMILSSCGNGTPSAKLENNVDSLSYLLGAAQTQGLREYMVSQLGVDTAYIDDFIRGINDGAAECSKSKAAYLAGLQIGGQVKNQMIKGINRNIVGEDSVEILNKDNFLAAFCTATKGEKTLLDIAEYGNKIDSMVNVVRNATMIKKYGKNKEAGEKYLAENAKKEGVQTLPSGVQYKVLTEGSGAKPTANQQVVVRYEGKTIDGKVFDSNLEAEEPATMYVSQVIPGFSEALQNMPAGSKWEIVIPQDLAYGPAAQAKIDPFSVLIFTVEVLEVK